MSQTGWLLYLFIANALLFQVLLIFHFAVRRWAFQTALRYGWVVYALSIPSALLSLLLALDGATWFLWAGGLLYLLWAAFGYAVEYIRKIEWRDPIRWGIFVPYIVLYLATVMFYWWPLARIDRVLWYLGAALFVISTFLNATSHHPSPAGENLIRQRKG